MTSKRPTFLSPCGVLLLAPAILSLALIILLFLLGTFVIWLMVFWLLAAEVVAADLIRRYLLPARSPLAGLGHRPLTAGQ
jgi:hypothetical protein